VASAGCGTVTWPLEPPAIGSERVPAAIAVSAVLATARRTSTGIERDEAAPAEARCRTAERRSSAFRVTTVVAAVDPPDWVLWADSGSDVRSLVSPRAIRASPAAR
jgi:hypothetical protein